MKPPDRGGWPVSWRLWKKTTSRTTLCPPSLPQVLLPAYLPSVSLKNQRRRRERRGATTSSSVSGRTSLRCWRRRISQRSRSLTTCQRRPRHPRYLHATSAASAGSRRTTPAPPAGGATAAPSVCAHTERRGVWSGRSNCHCHGDGGEGCIWDAWSCIIKRVWTLCASAGCCESSWTETHMCRCTGACLWCHSIAESLRRFGCFSISVYFSLLCQFFVYLS